MKTSLFKQTISLMMTVTLSLSTLPSESRAEEVQIFVSSFAPADKAGIYAFTVDTDTGELEETANYKDIAHPFFLALSPNKTTLYSIHGESGFGGDVHEEVVALRVIDGDGNLRQLNKQSTHGTASCYLDVDRRGRLLVVANYTTGDVASYALNSDGTANASAAFYKHAGSSVNESRQKEPHAHCIVISPDNKYIYSADLGIDKIVSYKLGKNGAIKPLGDEHYATVAPGSGPRHLTFHPNGKHLYVINELLNTITVFDYNARNGHLNKKQTIATLPADFEGTSHTADVKITPDGRFAYGTNRGHDSLACYKVLANGTLELIEIVESLGGGPQNLAVTPDGNLLICANMAGNNLVLFKINQAAGNITPIGKVHEIVAPSCIMIR